jgi:hypothetical protein
MVQYKAVQFIVLRRGAAYAATHGVYICGQCGIAKAVGSKVWACRANAHLTRRDGVMERIIGMDIIDAYPRMWYIKIQYNDIEKVHHDSRYSAKNF